MLDDGNGTAMGYILCAPDTPTFVERYKKEFLPVVAEYGIEKLDDSDRATDTATQLRREVFSPENMLHTEHSELVKEYPAHLHIDIMSSHQGQGWGPKMLATLTQKLQAEKIAGVHLGMDAKNQRAHPFYDRLGFERFTGMNANEEVGRKGGGVYRVKKTA